MTAAMSVSAHAISDNGAGASAATALAVGPAATAPGARSTAVGPDTVASGDNSTAVGWHSDATDPNAVAVGRSAQARSDDATATGARSGAWNTSASAYGADSVALGISSTAVGESSRARFTGASAFGSGATAEGVNATAIGSGAVSLHDGGLALGSGSATSLTPAAASAIDTTVMVGTGASLVTVNETVNATAEANLGNRLVSGVADGRISASSADAVNGSQLWQVIGAVSTNAGAIAVNGGLIAGNTTAIGVNAAGINALREGAAASAALPDMYLQADETWTVAGGLAQTDDGYGGSETGFGGGFQWRSDTSDDWSIGLVGGIAGDAYSVRLQARIGG